MPFGGGGGGVQLPVSIANGGTGQTTAAAALAALGGVGPGSHTFKEGSKAGDYTIASTSWADIDSTNLKVTVTVPVGTLAVILGQASGTQAAGSTGEVGISVDGAAPIYDARLGNGSGGGSFAVFAVFTGDGSSHAFSLQARVQNTASNHLTVSNGADPDNPKFLVLLLAAT